MVVKKLILVGLTLMLLPVLAEQKQDKATLKPHIVVLTDVSTWEL